MVVHNSRADVQQQKDQYHTRSLGTHVHTHYAGICCLITDAVHATADESHWPSILSSTGVLQHIGTVLLFQAVTLREQHFSLVLP